MEDFRKWAVKAAEWGADYRGGMGALPVRPNVEPGAVAAQLRASPPEGAEAFDAIFADFERLIAPAMTHWQHPRFFAYFPANAAPASIVAEHLVNALAANCMLWQTSPAATELETVMLDWMRQALGLDNGFSGVIQDAATSATLIALLTMRERALDWNGNREGLSGAPRLRVYCSAEAHVSVDRAVWLSGVGTDNLVRIPIKGPRRGADPEALAALIDDDLARGFMPIGVVANVGATGVGAVDPVEAMARVAKPRGLFLHVDAAWAGSAMICPEYRALWEGVDEADSVVVNPHKWLGAQFDCSLHYVKDVAALTRTLGARPDYLQTPGRNEIVNYSERSIPLGRRFRALKLWFLLRAYGLEGLRAMIRDHVRWSTALCERLRGEPDFEIVTAPSLSLFTFRHAPSGVPDLDAHNLGLVNRINTDGRIYLTQTRVDGRVAIRFQVGQFDCQEKDIAVAYDVITELARQS